MPVRKLNFKVFERTPVLYIRLITIARNLMIVPLAYSNFLHAPPPTAGMPPVPNRQHNRWSVLRECFCKSSARGCGDCTLVHLEAGDGYTRLVLRNPSNHSPAKGGTFVYISVPALLGTIEAHPMSVALRGAPPHLWNTVFDDGVFTLCESSTAMQACQRFWLDF